MKQLLGIFALVIWGSITLACPPNGQRVCVPVHKQVVHQAHRVVAVQNIVTNAVAVVPAVALYSASYDHYAANEQAKESAIAAELKLLREEFVKLREALTLPPPTVPPQPPVTTDNPPDLKEFQFNEKTLISGLTQCANCHQPSTANKLGGGLVLFDQDGKTKDFKDQTEKMHKKIIDSVTSGVMPKRGKLTPEQKEQIINYYSPESVDDSTPQK